MTTMDADSTRLDRISLDTTAEPEPEIVRGLTVKEMAPELQPREKALQHGIETLSVAELLAIVLRTGIPGMPITEMMRNMMKDNDGRLHNLERRSRPELKKYRGLGDTKALQLEAIFELIRKYNLEEAPKLPHISSSGDIFRLMRDRIGNLSHEEIWVLMLTRNNRVTALFRASSGGQSATVFDVKMIMKRALLEEASGIVLCHNHPSGNMIPSGPDDMITRKCHDAARSLDLRLVDHVIVGATDYYSYADHGKIV